MTMSMETSANTNNVNDPLSIETKNLNLWYGKFQALFDINARIKPRKITSLIGPSGCGKTTFLRCFNRMNERYGYVIIKGVLKVMGKNIYDPDVSLIELRKAVGMVFQRPNPLPLSIYDNIVFGVKIHSPKKVPKSILNDMVEESLRHVFLWDDLKDKLQKRATNLQLEQQQKLCIARLLPLKPQVLLMDEPCSALDAKGTETVEDLIKVLSEEYTTLIVTHNMAQARRVSHECIYMLNGVLVEHKKTAELFLNPSDKRTEEYIEGRYG